MKKFATKKDIIIIAVILLLGIALLCVGKLSPKGTVAIIEVEGKILDKVELNQNGFEKNYNGVVVCVENREAYIKSSTCKDKICVKSGKLKNKGDSAVCVPNKVVVKIQGEKKNSPHAITG